MQAHWPAARLIHVCVAASLACATFAPAFGEPGEPPAFARSAESAIIVLPPPPPAPVTLTPAEVASFDEREPVSPATLSDIGATGAPSAQPVPVSPGSREPLSSDTSKALPIVPKPAFPNDRPASAGPATTAQPGSAAARPGPAAAASGHHFSSDALKRAVDAFIKSEPLRAEHAAPAIVAALRSERGAIAALYAARNFAPLWIANGGWTAAAGAALARIDRAADDGLNLRMFPIPSFGERTETELAQAELGLSEAIVAYGRQASGGRVDPSRISALITAKPDVAEPAHILAEVVSAADAGAALQSFNPPQKGYALLRQKLAELRRERTPVARLPIPMGPTLRPGMRDPRVPLIRARIGLGSESASQAGEDLVYDTRVAAAVADFQRANGLPASGALTPRTIAALSGGEPARLEDEILANMERWRWLPRDMGADRIEVNIPDYALKVFEGERIIHRARVVVGKQDNPTPVFSNTMQFIIVNPYWNVPLSIIKKEMLPKLDAEPDFFTRHGYEVIQRGGQLYVRQPPGDSNALGRIKFMFPNQYSVYLHDTPSRSLFAAERRAFSHGCVRVEQPFKLAEIVLGPNSGWSEPRIKRLIGGNERTLNLAKPLPIHLLYFTATVDEAGKLQLRDDVYGYSHRVRQALGLEG